MVEFLFDLFAHVNTAGAEQIVTFFGGYRFEYCLGCFAWRLALGSWEKLLVGGGKQFECLPKGKSCLSDFDGLKDSQISYLSHHVLIDNYSWSFFFIWFNTSYEMVGG